MDAPVTDQTKIIMEMQKELQMIREDTYALRKETTEIRHMLQRGETWRNNFWRAVTNFVSFTKSDQGKHNGTD